MVNSMRKWDKMIGVKLSEEDLQRIKEAASRKGLTMTSYLRMVALESLQREQLEKVQQNQQGGV